MNKSSKKLKELDFKKIALGIFFPSGELIYINKIKGYQYHIEYLKDLFLEDVHIRSILKDINFDYYVTKPNKVALNIFPLFQNDGCFIYANLSPNTCLPTTWAIFYLSDSITLEQKNLMKSLQEKFKEIVFLDIAKFDKETFLNSPYFENTEIGTPNYEMLYEILESW